MLEIDFIANPKVIPEQKFGKVILSSESDILTSSVSHNMQDKFKKFVKKMFRLRKTGE